jgi:hypothetical protein
VKEAQTELARLGCYSASINGKFDEATKKSLALYHSKKGSLADGDHLSDGILSELKQQNLGLCPEEKPAAPVIATPVPEQKTKEQANREEEARPEHKRHKIEKAAREEQEPASAPPRHRTHSAAREEEPVSRPPRHRTQSAAREEESAPGSHQRAHPSFATSRPKSVVAGRAPRMPPRPTAEAERVQPERRAAEERAKVAVHEEEDRKKHKILETGYSLLKDIGGEDPDYGLYSYAIMVNDSDRSAKFLSDVFSVGETVARPSQTNVLYIPLKRNRAKEWSKGLKLGYEGTLHAAFAKEFYDYKISRAILDHLCDSSAEEIRGVCEGDLSRGPYIFAYARPASKVTPVPPPFLFMDLSDVHERAFPEIIAAFRTQVKRDDISDRAKIDTLRLKVLSIVLTAADWLVPMQKAVADIVHSASGQSERDKK